MGTQMMPLVCRIMNATASGVARSAAMKDEMLAELDRVNSRQRDTVGQIQASEDQLSRAEKMFKQLEQRRTQVAFGEKKLAAVVKKTKAAGVWIVPTSALWSVLFNGTPLETLIVPPD